MSLEILRQAERLASAGEPFVLVTVVWRRGPSSGRQGAKAIIRRDGTVRGWLGGACAQPTVVQEALAALGDGRPRLLFLGPPDEAGGEHRRGMTMVPMACESEGAMEVYLEPMIPAPRVVAIGRSPAVDALARLADGLGWRAVVVDDGGDPADHPGVPRVETSLDLAALDVDEHTFVVVGTQGHYDPEALQAALATPAGYVGLIASEKRTAAIFAFLRSRGVSDEALARVRAPAGLDLGNIEHAEMAVSILAQLVELKALVGIAAGVTVEAPATAVDPVCGMTVEIAGARYSTEHGGTTRYFCAPGCMRAFEETPDRFPGSDERRDR